MNYKDIENSYDRIKNYIYKTPFEESMFLSDSNRRVYLKYESLQRVKSFKIRGAFSKMTGLSKEEKLRGVVAISSGNHGVAVSYAATILGIEKVKIIVPKNTPSSKVNKIRYYGGQVIFAGDNYDEAHSYGEQYIKDHNMTVIDAYYEDPEVYAGQGTVGLEMLRENPQLDALLVPVGGGGLITGVAVAAKHIKPSIKIIGVQPEACPAMLMSMKKNIFYKEYPTAPSICEALVGGIGKLAFEKSNDVIDEIILVSEEYVRLGVKHVIEKEKFIVEPSSAICVGALLQHERYFGDNLGLVMTGGNLDEKLMMEILNA